MKAVTFLLTQFQTRSETQLRRNLLFKNLKIIRVICTSNTSAYYVNILDRIRRLRTAGRESGETSICIYIILYIYIICTHRVLVLVEERTRRHGGAKPVAIPDSQIEDHVVLIIIVRFYDRSLLLFPLRKCSSHSHSAHTNDDNDNDIDINICV